MRECLSNMLGLLVDIGTPDRGAWNSPFFRVNLQLPLLSRFLGTRGWRSIALLRRFDVPVSLPDHDNTSLMPAGVAFVGGGLSTNVIQVAIEIGIGLFRRCPLLVFRFWESATKPTTMVPVTLFLFE
jgi:hypothetical protein